MWIDEPFYRRNVRKEMSYAQKWNEGMGYSERHHLLLLSMERTISTKSVVVCSRRNDSLFISGPARLRTSITLF